MYCGNEYQTFGNRQQKLFNVLLTTWGLPPHCHCRVLLERASKWLLTPFRRVPRHWKFLERVN